MGTVHRQSSATASVHWSYPDVPLTDYRSDASPGITKQVLVGLAEGASDFVVRYFTIPSGGRSALDQHDHQHGVVITHGHGRVLLGTEWHVIGPGDAVFTDSNEIHQLEASPTDTLGFICVIPRWAEEDPRAIPAR
jgi:quercetin dioxygenase-like cupin family protein